MSFLLKRRGLATRLVEASKVANKLTNIEFPPDIINRSCRWQEAKRATVNLCVSPRVDRIRVLYNGLPKPETELSMAKGVSTPLDCAKHLSQLLCDRSVIALVNGSPYDMHRPITADVTLDFIHFKDIHNDPTEANLAFWHSCQIIMAAAIESAFKDEFRMRLLSFRETSLRSGSFVADFRMELGSKQALEAMADWSPAECELRALSQVGQTIASNARPFEVLDTSIGETRYILQDDYRLACLHQEAGSTSSTLYRVGDYVQVHSKTPMIANSSLVGRFSIASLRLLGRLAAKFAKSDGLSYQLVYRAQGVAVPAAFLAHFSTFDVLIRRAKQPNVTVTNELDYVEPL
ncbi:39S ribosomal protein L39 mitochondrial [Taenia crassiceps]|uniref:39S ribosomal protein L39 mitochondrial n=1 Tax=Taenia crassiceps TaxID=6207 RepID=A0ABR4QDE0_9CEST